MSGLRPLIVASIGLAVTGCASVPPVQMNYYLPTSTMTVDVVRTVGCDDQDNFYVANTVTPKIVYRADYGSPQTIRLNDLSGPAGNLQSGFTFTEDGRLSGFNATQTGVGGEVVRGALALLDAVAPGAADGPAVSTACQYVRDNGKDKVMTLTFSLAVDFARMPQNMRFRPGPGDLARFEQVKAIIGDLCQNAEIVRGSSAQRVTTAPLRDREHRSDRNDVAVTLRQPAVVKLSVHQTAALTGGTLECPAILAPTQGVVSPVVWEGYAAVPQLGATYTLPVPRAALFGTQSFSFAMTESGALTTVQYGRVSGAVSAMGAATDIVSHFEDDTAAETAAGVKAQADIIAQQERLVRCRANPVACT